MSERFDKYVKEHRDDFDFFEPDAALWNKIENRLDKKPKSRNLSFLWKAAAILIIFGLSFWAQMQIEETPKIVSRQNTQDSSSAIAHVPQTEEVPTTETPAENDLLPDFAETEKYYNRKVNNTMKDLKVYLAKYPDVASDMKKDIAELDSVYHALKRDLGDNVAHEEILSAMIQNYRMKLQILEDIKNELIQNSAVKPKNNSHEI